MSTLTFAGHSAVFLTIADSVVAIDPWLEGNPSCPEDLKNPEQIDFIVLTHGHADHASDTVRLAQKTGAKVLATYELANLLIADGVAAAQVIHMNKGGTCSEAGISFSLTHAMHSSSYDGTSGTAYAGEPCGVVIQTPGLSVYHAGDTALFSDMSLIAEQYSPSIALLPIGDCFTMGPEEAAKAARILAVKTVIPIHYNTFPALSGSPQEFQKHLKDASVNVIVLEPGQSVSTEDLA